MIQRSIPKTGEALPAIGLGTWQTFDIASALLHKSDEPVKVLGLLDQAGGTVVDTSPMYGQAESALGAALRMTGLTQRLFLATKVWTRGEKEGEAQMRESMRLLGRDRIDLMQIHNLLDWRVHLRTIRRWKTEGLVRYIGITHYTASAYDELEAVVRAEEIDFIQFAYSPRYRHAERSLLPRCADREVAVLVNRPFEEGATLRRVRDRPLPKSVASYASTWSEAILKWILANPAVTCVIPATARTAHMAANLAAGHDRLPTETEREELSALLG